MFRVIKNIKLLSICTVGSFDNSLAFNCKGPTKCLFLNNRPCQARPTLIKMNFDQPCKVRRKL